MNVFKLHNMSYRYYFFMIVSIRRSLLKFLRNLGLYPSFNSRVGAQIGPFRVKEAQTVLKLHLKKDFT